MVDNPSITFLRGPQLYANASFEKVATGCAVDLTISYTVGATGFSTPTWNGVPSNQGNGSGSIAQSSNDQVLAFGFIGLLVGLILVTIFLIVRKKKNH